MNPLGTERDQVRDLPAVKQKNPTVSLVLQTVQEVLIAVQLKRDEPGHMIIICVYSFE